MSNTITAFFKGRVGVAESVYQYDYGKVLIIDGLNLPAVFEAHFTTLAEDDAITVIGQNNRVAIPDNCINKTGVVTAYIYLHSGDNDGETEYVIRFAVVRRAKPDYEATDEERTELEAAIQTAIALLQNPRKVNMPLDENNQVDYGEPGQHLRTKGNGATEWVTEGLPTDEQTAEAVSTWLDAHPEATTTVEDGSLVLNKFKPKEMPFVTPEQFGASGDGIADDTDAMQAAINSGVKHIKGVGTYRLNSRVYVSNKDGLLLSGLKIISEDDDHNPISATIDIVDSSNIHIENCEFIYGISTIHLFTCSDIYITNCIFDHVGYSIIQEDGYVSNNVTICGNHCKDAVGDFVECNCETNAPSKNWIINGNLYDRSEKSNTYKNENRFVGMTAISDVIISDNLIINTRGHAIHGEDFGGRILVTNNIFVDNVGNDIDIDNGLKTAIIQGNYFYNSLTKDVASRYRMINLSGGENRTEYKVRIDGNTFIGNGTQSMPIFLDTANIYEKQVTNNWFYGFDTIFVGHDVYVNNLLFANNIVNCDKFINNPKDFGGGTIVDSIFSSNKITGDIILSDDGNGTRYPTNIEFNGNIIKGDVTVSACRNFVFVNNIIPSDYAVSISDIIGYANNSNLYTGRMNEWTQKGSKNFACSAADTFENSGLSFTVPDGETWEVYILGTFSNSATKSYGISDNINTVRGIKGTRFIDCGLKSPICVCTSGTYYVWIAQESSGSNTYYVYAKSV